MNKLHDSFRLLLGLGYTILYSRLFAMDFLVFIVFHLMVTLVLIVNYCDFLCYLVYRPRGCNKLELTLNCRIYTLGDKFIITVV